jgi:Malectin domain/Transmembrane protein 131-like N-terminal
VAQRGQWTGRVAALVAGTIAVGLAACTTSPSGTPQAAPTSVVFPQTVVGGEATQNVVISNVAQSGTLTIESTGIAGTDAAMFADRFDDDGSVALAPGQSTTVAVVFSPTAAGSRSATLRVNHSGSGSFGIPLSGTAVNADPGARPLVASPASLSFPGTTVGQSAALDVTLRNGATTGPIEVSSVAVSGPDADMFTTSFASPTTLQPGGSATVRVTFSPTASGARSATLVATHTGTNSPLPVALSGQANLAEPGVVLYRVDAGGPGLPGTPRWAPDSSASPSPYANASATGNTVSTSGAAVDLSHPSVPADTPLEVFRTERWDAPAAPNLTYGFPVPSGSEVEVRLYLAETYSPAQVVGGRVFDVKVDGTTKLRDVDVFARAGANRGLVLSTPVVSDGKVDVQFVPGVGDPSIKGIEVVTADESAPPWLAATPTAVDFPDATVRQAMTQDVTLTNLGTSGSLTVSSTSITGPGEQLFADRFDGAVTLAPGASTTVPVTYLPTAAGSHAATLTVTHSGVASPLVIPLTGTARAPAGGGTGPSFRRATLSGAGVGAPTSLQFGPDGRLYVAQFDGTIRALTIARSATGQYSVTANEVIGLIRAMPNRNDDGTLNASVTGRLVTGLVVTGTPQSPTVYAVSSDPRIGAGTDGTDLNLDTNSGILSRLTKSGASWQKTDLVRGLPRSEENHTGNGLSLDPATNNLLIAHGGNTNKGAPSHNFAFLPEYALSGAILSVDLDTIGNTTYDLPTLDDEDRAGTTDANDPFGGNDGKNQARLVPGGPVQVYAPGFRNAYDLVRTAAGNLYTIDNGGNAGWGGAPVPDNTSGACSNDPVETSDTDGDSLMRIPGPGFYGGHPNPTRANRSNTFNPSKPQSPVAVASPVECDYRNETARGAMTSFGHSTNGLDEYTASAFDGAMRGDLLTASYDDSIRRIELTADGTGVTSNTVLFSNAGSLPLDVTAQADAEPFPGTVWVADFQGNAINVFEPDSVTCTGADDPALDEDGDGYDNADEIDNGTGPCSSADVPPDADGDRTSDRNDPDDDNDGRPDTSDRFAVDALDGRGTSVPSVLTWDNDAPPPGGLLGIGFTGLMTNGTSDYATLFDSTKMTTGGAAGVVTVDEASDGDALGAANTQEYGFQHGVDVTGTSPAFVVHTRLPAPFSGTTPTGDQSYGVFFGTGTQDDYVKLAVAANGGAGGFRLVDEQGGAPSTVTVNGPAWPGPGAVDLYLRVDPASHTVQASYALDGAAPVAIGAPRTVPAAWFTGVSAPAVGLISTSTGTAPPFPATWDFLEVQPAAQAPLTPSTAVAVGAAGLNSSTYNSGSFRVTNTSAGGQQIASVRLDLPTSLLPDLVFDPNGTAGDTVSKGFTVDADPGVGTIGHQFTGSHDGGYDALDATFTDFGPGETLTFSVDVDPTSIKGSAQPGPGESGSVSGLELTGAAVTVTYEDGTSQSGRLFRSPGSLGQSQARLDGVARPATGMAVVGLTTPATVTQPAQVVRVTGPAGASVRLLAAEGALFTAGLAGGGFDLDPYEANSVVAVSEHATTIGTGGTVDVPVTLTSTVAGGGNNRFVAVIDAQGGTGPTSPVAVVQLGP